MSNSSGYIRLSKDFHPKATDENFYLIDLKEPTFIPEPCKLLKEQYQLLLKLNGEYTLDQILKNYPKTQQKDIVKFISNLEIKNAIRYSNNRTIRKFAPPAKEPHLREVHFELTSACNLPCLHCYQEEYLRSPKNKELSIRDIKKLAQQLHNLNVVKMSISGGEPFLRPKLALILHELEKNGIRVDCIFTNGTLIGKPQINLLKELSSTPHIFISLDGPDPKSHGKIRGIAQNKQEKLFTQIIENINLLVRNKILVKINTMVYRDNVNKLPEMYKLMKKLGIKMWRLAIPKFVGRYPNHYSDLICNKDELEDNYKSLVKLFLDDIRLEKNKIIVPLDLRIANVFKTQMLTRTIVKYSLDDSACEYMRHRVTVKPNGDVLPCGLLINSVIGNTKNTPLDILWYSSKMQSFKEFKIRKVVGCKGCKYIRICGTGCRVNSLFEYNNLVGKDEEACLCFDFFNEIIDLIEKRGFVVKINDKEKKGHRDFRIQLKGTQYFMK